MVYLPQPNVDLSLATHSPIDWDSTLNGKTASAADVPAPEAVLLVPGKLTEVAVKIKNNSQQQLRVRLGLQGGFPDAWFDCAESWQENTSLAVQQSLKFSTHYFELPPHQTVYKTLGFTLPHDFFEDPNALRSHQHLTLGFDGEVFLHHQLAGDEQAVQLIAYKTLQLYTRPSRIYQQFLPEFYQESDFLGRFLSIFEQSFEPVYETAETFWAYLDPLLTPKALVPFLAHWVAWPMNSRLPLSQQRRLIRHAVEIYQWRGTARGLTLCLQLCTGLEAQQIEITEPDEREFAVGEITLGDAPSLGGGKAYHFIVILKPDTQDQLDGLDEAALRALIEQEKPAFCTYDLEIVHPAAALSSSPPSDDPQTVVSDGVG
ncbi:MAG: phage tail protein [Cyanobacteria bacterium P01_H01_bin.105]